MIMKYDVCVFGGCSLDQMYYQNSDGSYDCKPNMNVPGGKGANQAVAAARAGVKTTIITRLGKDEIGKLIVENLKSNCVDTSNVELIEEIKNDYSNIYINILDKDNDIKRISGAINSFTVDMIEEYKDVLLKSKIIVCQLKIPKEVTEKLINFCYDNNKLLMLTPCRPEKLSISDGNNIELIDKIGIIICNKQECETIFNTSDIEFCVKKYPNKLIVTLGADGLIYFNGKRIVKMPAINYEVLDTTGAGDTLCGNLAAFLSKGLDIQHALRKSMYASTMKLAKKSAQAGMPYYEELENFISKMRNKKFVYNEELDFALELVKNSYDLVNYDNKFDVDSKGDRSVLTDCDIEIEKSLLNKISKKYPNDCFITRDSFQNTKLGDRTWIVAPIDKTIHFIKKDGFWGIQLAFYDKGSTKFSIIYLPMRNELYYAAENQGAYINNNKVLPTEVVSLDQVIVEFGGSLYREFDSKKIYLKNLISNDKMKSCNILYINSSCVSYTNLVSGKTDALIIDTNELWDTMPGEFICTECGISVTYLDFDKKLKLITNNNDVKELVLGFDSYKERT